MDVRKMASMGQRAMRKQQSKAERVFWPLQAGRPRQLKPNLLEAILIGRKTANRIFAAMIKAKLSEKDSKCVLVCSGGDRLACLPRFTPDDQESCDVKMAVRVHENKWKPIGIAFYLVDREKWAFLKHKRAFERTELNDRILSAVLDDWAISEKQGTSLRCDW
jgi:hypothetical protein